MCLLEFSCRNKNITDFLHSLCQSLAKLTWILRMILTFYIKVRYDVPTNVCGRKGGATHCLLVRGCQVLNMTANKI